MTRNSSFKAIISAHRWRPVLFIAVFCSALACTTNTGRAAKLTAYATYYRSSYQEKCHSGVNNPKTCEPCQAIIQKADTRAAAAATNAKLGYMPVQQVTEIDQTLVDLAGCP